MTREDFIQHYVVRLAPEPDRVEDAVKRASAVWEKLCGLGCVEEIVEPELIPRQGTIHSGTDWLGYPRREEKTISHSLIGESTAKSSGVTLGKCEIWTRKTRK